MKFWAKNSKKKKKLRRKLKLDSNDAEYQASSEKYNMLTFFHV